MRIRITKEDKVLLKAVFNSLMKYTPEPLEQYPDTICEMDIVLADIIKTLLKKKELLPIPKISKDIHQIISNEYNLHHDEIDGVEILAHYYLYKIGIATLLKYQMAYEVNDYEEETETDEDSEEETETDEDVEE